MSVISGTDETDEELDGELGEQFTIICFENDEGEVSHFAVVDTAEYEGDTYCALVAYDIETDDFIDSEDDEDVQEFYIVKEISDGDETDYIEVEDDELNDKLCEIFSGRLEELFGEEDTVD